MKTLCLLALVFSLATRRKVEGAAMAFEEQCSTLTSGQEICATGALYSPSPVSDGETTSYEGPYEATFTYTKPGKVKDVEVSVKWPDGDASSVCTVSINGEKCTSCTECEGRLGPVRYDCTNVKSGKSSGTTCESIDYNDGIFFPLTNKAFTDGTGTTGGGTGGTDDTGGTDGTGGTGDAGGMDDTGGTGDNDDNDDKGDGKEDEDDNDKGAGGKGGNAARTKTDCISVVKEKCNCRSESKKNRDCAQRIVSRFCKKVPSNQDRKSARQNFVAKCDQKNKKKRSN